MLLMKLLSPEEVPLIESSWGVYHRFYRFLLRKFVPLYSRGAIDDTFEVGGVTVSHTVRDPWFETELSRFKISLAPHLTKRQELSYKKNNNHRSCIFSWRDSLSLMYKRKSCCVTHDSDSLFESRIKGELQTSMDDDVVKTLRFVENKALVIEHIEKEPENEKPLGTGKKRTVKKQKIHLKDESPIKEEKSEVKEQKKEPVKKQEPPANNFVKHKGFEENDIF